MLSPPTTQMFKWWETSLAHELLELDSILAEMNLSVLRILKYLMNSLIVSIPNMSFKYYVCEVYKQVHVKLAR